MTCLRIQSLKTLDRALNTRDRLPAGGLRSNSVRGGRSLEDPDRCLFPWLNIHASSSSYVAISGTLRGP